MVLDVSGRTLAKASDSTKKVDGMKKSSAKPVHERPQRRDDVFDGGSEGGMTRAEDLGMRAYPTDEGDMDEQPLELHGTAVVEQNRVIAGQHLGDRQKAWPVPKQGRSDFLRYEVRGDSLVRVGEADLLPDVAVVTKGDRAKKQERIFVPAHRGEMGPNQYQQVIVESGVRGRVAPHGAAQVAPPLMGRTTNRVASLPVQAPLDAHLDNRHTTMPQPRFYGGSMVPPLRRPGNGGVSQNVPKQRVHVAESNFPLRVRREAIPVDRFFGHRQALAGQAGPSREVFRGDGENYGGEFVEDAYATAEYLEDD